MVPRSVVTEGRQGRTNQLGHAIRVLAGAAPLDQAGHGLHIRSPDPALKDQIGQGIGQRGQPEDTRPALPRRLGAQVARDPRGFGESAGRLGQRDDDAGAERAARRRASRAASAEAAR